MRYRILLITFLAVMVTLGLVSCSEEESSGEAGWYARNTLYSYSGNQGNLWDPMRKHLRMPSDVNNRQVQAQIHWFEHHQAYLNHVIAESAPYIYYIYQQTQKHNLPAELALIPIIESDYNPYARSDVGAIGLWQMMPKTAAGFGLRRDWWYDGRKDVVASTNAALEYFTYLHSLFHGNWLLAIAAYDCGEGAVMNAMRHNQMEHRSGSFWNLPLPNETRNYVPRLLAVAAIVRSPGHYGIHLAPIDDAPYLTQLNVDSPITLSKAAKLAEVPLSTLKVLNPGVQHDKMDPHGPYTIVLPQDKVASFKEKLAALTHNEKIKLHQHVVQSRETFAKATQKYKTNMALLKQSKGLKKEGIQPNQPLLIPAPAFQTGNNVHVAKNDRERDQSVHANATAAATAQALAITYEVRKGDNLGRIAHRFHTTVAQLKESNPLKKDHLQIGETLSIPTSSLTTHSHSPTAETSKTDIMDNKKLPHHKIYIVRKGDYIERIARRHHVSVADLKRWNSQLSNIHLKPGQKIIIQENA